MFDQIKAAIDMFRDMPDAVGYDEDRTIYVPMPVEMLDAIENAADHEVSGLRIKLVQVYNESHRTQRLISVYFAGGWMPSYTPRIMFEKRTDVVRYQIRDSHFLIEEIPPDETVQINVFNPLRDFKVRQVLVGDVAITRMMQRLADSKRHPDFLKHKVAFVFSMLVVAVAVPILVFAFYMQWKNTEESQKIQEALLGFSGCTLFVYENGRGKEPELASRVLALEPYFQRVIFTLNQVTSVEELKRKPKPVLCREKP